jgi:D-alanyl-lipoteichoic acid acyltransferase DltB (MBOAT superfamily)
VLFNSFAFLLFFVVVYCLYWAMGRRWRAQNTLLLCASLFFYGWWDVRFLFLFILTTTVDFYSALMIAKGRVPLKQRLVESAILVLSAFFFVTVNWNAVNVAASGWHFSAAIDWAKVLPQWGTEWIVFACTIIVVTVVNASDRWMSAIDQTNRRKVFVVASVVSNLSVLGVFKYYNFMADSFARIAHAATGITPSGWTLHIVLPVGISFYTFQSLAYTIDVYRRKFEPIPSYLTLATGLSFFPLLVAGPIERPHQLLPQFLKPRSQTWDSWREGIWLVVWGLFKKMVVADNMAIVVAGIFHPYDGSNPSHVVPADGLRMLLGVYAFAFQIYGDFSGYSDIARGTGRLLGFEVMRNFNLPYFAISPSDFWQRWHISLSSWLRDYLYIPLGGNRGSDFRTYCNLFLTMLLGGLWHGAAWTFVVWGAYHGTILIIYRLIGGKSIAISPSSVAPRPHLARRPEGAVVTAYMTMIPIPSRGTLEQSWPTLRRALLILLMFHLTCVGWLLFRAQNMTTVVIFLQSLFLHPAWSPAAATVAWDIVFYSWFLVLFQIIQATMGTLDPMKRLPWFVRLNIWIVVIMSLLTFRAETPTSFIYFAF